MSGNIVSQKLAIASLNWLRVMTCLAWIISDQLQLQVPPLVVIAVLLVVLSLIVSLIAVLVQTIRLVRLHASDDTNHYKCTPAQHRLPPVNMRNMHMVVFSQI